MKVSFGIITKNFLDLGTLELFLANSKQHNHSIHSIIIAYQNSCDFKLVEKLQSKVKVDVIKINSINDTLEELKRQGVNEDDGINIIYSKYLERTGYTPYGVNRNNVLVKAMLNGTDILLFIDTDVYPYILYKAEDSSRTEKIEIDFVGEHLSYLVKDDVSITTSDYSGYFIIPSMEFDGMDKLFKGLQKNTHFKELVDKRNVDSLVYGNIKSDRQPFETSKILGGNLGIKLKDMKNLPPFYSTVIKVKEDIILTRGEDTLLGLHFKDNKSDKKCMDIDLKIFHDTFSSYPIKPNIIKNPDIRDRFYYACMGWIGRNPFLNWMQGDNVKEIYEEQRENLVIGAEKIAKYLDDARFKLLVDAIDISFENLGMMIDEYEITLESWQNLTKRIL